MRILFIYSVRYSVLPDQPLLDLESVHLGLSCVAEAVRAQGHATRLAVLGSRDSPKRTAEVMETVNSEFDPQIIAFTSVSTEFPFIHSLAGRIRARWPGKYLIIGGVHATLNPQSVMQDTFDALCVGEGEQPLAELAEQLGADKSPSGISNLWVRRPDGAIEKNPTKEFCQDLDTIPIPDRQMWLPWTRQKDGATQVVLLGRGCPYHCTYCCSNALGKIAPGKYVRFRSPTNILKEIRGLHGEFPALHHVYLQAETIAVNLPWLEELSRLIAEFNQSLETPVAFTCNFRVARRFLTDPIFATLQRANVRTLEIGLESGSERLRRDVLRRPYSDADFFEAVALARQHGMRVNIYNMIGLPGETLEEHWQTVAANHRVCPDRSNTCIFYPFPGTHLYEVCRKEGYLKGELDLSVDRDTAVLDYPAFRKADIQRCFEWFDYRIYKGHKPLHVRLRKVLRKKINAHPWLMQLFTRLLPWWYKLTHR
jgi:anaerobic magnesium-protoporphyrin IX monomethyl ester cyclase